MIPSNDPRRLIARLAVGMAAIDGRVASNELMAMDDLDRVGLGHLSDVAQEELLAAIDQPIDLGETCEVLADLGPQTGFFILTLLAQIAVSDGMMSQREADMFHSVAARLGVARGEAARLLESAVAAAHARPTHTNGGPAVDASEARQARCPSVPGQAWTLLGVEPGASRERLEAAYLAAVERYDPAKVIPLGAEFVSLAIRKLAELTDAFEKTRASG
jgi:DnaJ-domain-containing protein 1